MTAPTTPAALTVAATLTAHPDGITTRALADASGVSASTVAKTLTAMEADGTATRTPGPANGNRKSADIWHPVTPTDASPADASPADAAPADETPADASPADASPADETPADASPADASPADVTPADASPADETPADASPADAGAVAPVSGAPVGPRQPDLKVLIMAGVLGGHPEGITADAAINESGLSVAMGDTILAAMEVSGAARRLPTEPDGTELWVPVADADLAKVDPANAPTHTTCPTCGHTRKIRRPSARRAPATSTGRSTGEVNTDGSAKLGKGELERMVEAFMRDLGTGHDVSPVTVGRELGGRSSGACGNAMSKLTGRGVLVMTSEAPVRYALAETAPAPTADVRTYMTRPLTDGEPATGTDAGTADTSADEPTPGTDAGTTGTDAGTADTTDDATTTDAAAEATADDATATGDDETGTPATDEAPAAAIAA
ncbi:MarR family transcriptional regulator [Actinoplanes sp. NBRC 103695]|uniref:MarR family transcriptional regulator n=1 Tax=Actinoplanes sp. NBRC 103695 TaxID=3032202 RepID=UPI0025528201|nr:MarR family transcriptional regulator [Actinoplanes sp. NBRC 103695]